MKLVFNVLGVLVVFSGLMLTEGCKVDDPEIPNEEELITTVQLVLTPVSGGEKKMFIYQDLDGDGGNSPIITLDTLDLDSQYYGELKVLNELESPAENITTEVEEEGVDHQFFYTNDNDVVAVMYNDKDANGNPLGINTNIEAKKLGKGDLGIVLRHKPKKPNDGTLVDAGGETDIEISFEIVVR